MGAVVLGAYVFVAIGVFIGRYKDEGSGVFVALCVAFIWPVLMLMGFGRKIA